MKRAKIFFLSTAILLCTAGVFAGKKKYTTGTIYAYGGTRYCQLTAFTTLDGLTTTPPIGCTQAKITVVIVIYLVYTYLMVPHIRHYIFQDVQSDEI